MSLSVPSVYVGTYAKYNSGSLFGKWIDLDDYSSKEEFYEACHELHSDESDAEFMFQDWENIPLGDQLIGESWIDDKVWEILESIDDEDDLEKLEAYINAANCKVDYALEHYKSDYFNRFESYEDLGRWALAETGEIPRHLEFYFDYKAYGEAIAEDYLTDGEHYWYY